MGTHSITLLAAIFAASVLMGCQKSSPLPEGHEGPHGGDRAQLVFKNAQNLAIRKLETVKACSLRAEAKPGLASWLLDHQRDLIEDVKASKHAWTSQSQASCAGTSLSRNSELKLSYGLCSGMSEDDAARILIHESVHHFGITDEDFATEVAQEVFSTNDSSCIPAESEILWIDGDVTAWPRTAKIETLEPSTNQLCMKLSGTDWPQINPDGNYWTLGNYWIIARIEGQWLASTHEWITPESLTTPCLTDTPATFADGTGRREFAGWRPRSGETVGIMVSSVIRRGFSNGVRERSAIRWVRWP